MLYELVTDEVPYPRATTFDKAAEFFDAPVPDPRARRPDLPLWLARIIKRLLAKDPRQRFRNAGAVRDALEGPRRLGGRHLALLTLVMTLLVCAFGWYRANRHSDWRPEVQRRLPAYEEITNDPVISPDGQRMAYVSNRGDGQWRLYVEPMAGGAAQAITRGEYLYPIRWTHDGRAILGVSRDARALRITLRGGATEEVARNVHDIDDCAGRLVLASSGIEPCPDCYRLLVLEGEGAAHGSESSLDFLPASRCKGFGAIDKGGNWLTIRCPGCRTLRATSIR